MRVISMLLLACAMAMVHASPAPLFHQRPGTGLPLDAVFRDADGHVRQLSSYFGTSPVIMVFGYYHCPRLCSTIMDGVLQVARETGLPYTIVGVGIDPRETSDDAARKLKAYRRSGEDTGALHLLTGQQHQIARLAKAAGFTYSYDREHDQYSHPAGFLIATPDGVISRYFSGLRFDSRDVRLALIEASDERVGSLTEQVLLLCSHYDPLAGRYTVTVMTVVRMIGLLTLIGLAGGIWIARRNARRPS
ncbi:SCO family protein [Allopusillimonas soli]|nr:SCO family protein [Allopusillimonas soli]TEA75802.1 SCO family protein [Allopusillimonas soli]